MEQEQRRLQLVTGRQLNHNTHISTDPHTPTVAQLAKRGRTLGLGAAADHESAGTNAGLHLGALEVDNVTVVEEEVCLLDTGHSVALELLEDALEALVFVAGGLVHGLLLAADRASATGTGRLQQKQQTKTRERA